MDYKQLKFLYYLKYVLANPRLTYSILWHLVCVMICVTRVKKSFFGGLSEEKHLRFKHLITWSPLVLLLGEVMGRGHFAPRNMCIGLVLSVQCCILFPFFLCLVLILSMWNLCFPLQLPSLSAAMPCCHNGFLFFKNCKPRQTLPSVHYLGLHIYQSIRRVTNTAFEIRKSSIVLAVFYHRNHWLIVLENINSIYPWLT